MTTSSYCKLVTSPAPRRRDHASWSELRGVRETFRLLKEKGLGRECKFVLVSRLVECKPSANEGDPTGRFFI
jgi:hypothetical protein